MTLMQLKAFECLAKALNYAKAAEVLFISQPAVSQLIKSLEEELGTALFKRSTRKVELTEAGTMFFEDTKDVLLRLDDAVIRVRNYSEHFSVSLRISISDGPVMNRIDRIIGKFSVVEPNVHLHIGHSDHVGAFINFAEGKSDICFGVLDEEHGIAKSMRFDELMQGRFACYVPEDSRLASRSSLQLSDLSGSLFVFAQNDVCPPDLKKMQNKILKHFPSAIGYYSNSPEITLSMIRAGLGISVLPDFLFNKTDGVKAIPLEDSEILRYGIFSRTADRNEAIKCFSKVVKESILE